MMQIEWKLKAKYDPTQTPHYGPPLTKDDGKPLSPGEARALAKRMDRVGKRGSHKAVPYDAERGEGGLE